MTARQRCAVGLLWISLIIPLLGWGADIDEAAFTKRFMQPFVVSELGMGVDRLAPLGPAQMTDVLDAKAALGRFFKSLEDPKGSIERFVTPAFAKAKPSRLAVRQALVADETTILEMAVFDFQFLSDKKSLELRFYVVVMTEGTFEVSEGRAEMSKLDSYWRVSKIGAKP